MAAVPSDSNPRALQRVSAVLGNTAEEAWRDRLSNVLIDVVRLNQSEAHKSRLRTATEGGTEVAITLERTSQLRDGDVLAWDQAGRRAIVARIDLQDVMIIDLAELGREPLEVAMARCVELGHAVGNQHWPAVVSGSTLYVPVTVARSVMASVIKTHAFEDVGYSFAPGAQVIPALTVPEARRLFGAAGGHRHDEPAT
jgi:urease accessory protein